MNLGNTNLVRYGIFDEKAEVRGHVSPTTKHIYVFLPERAREAIEKKEYAKKPAFTGRLVTAKGYCIPPEDIKGCKAYPIPEDLLKEANFSKKDTTSEKGRKAEMIGEEMLRRGIIPAIITVNTCTDVNKQIDGVDATITVKCTYQFKCDYDAGPKMYGGSGNLYIQTEECNPFNQH